MPSYRPRDQEALLDDPASWVSQLANSEELYLVGGGYLNDLWHLDYSLLPVAVARELGVPIQTAPIQIGPFATRKARAWVAEVLMGAKLVVRDQASLEICRSCGLDAELAIDDVFRVDEVMPELRPAMHARETRRIGVCAYRQIGAGSLAG
jgi:polysaccharide pyruvyl transferase WcaK-like protein